MGYVGRDLEAISVSFVSGVTVGAVLPHSCSSIAAALSCAILPLLILSINGKGHRIPQAMLCFFMAGVFCYSSASLRGSGGTDTASFVRNTMVIFRDRIDKAGFGMNTEGLVHALLTGDKSGITRETIEVFRRSGASHILALSGLHLGVIYGILCKALGFMGNSIPASISRSVLIVSACGFYTAMTGASPSIVRAFIFIVINEFSRQSPGRRKDPVSVLCAALTIQLGTDPQSIMSVGFQLSYLAMTGIVTVFPKMESWYPTSGRKGLFGKIWTVSAMALSCQLFTAPLVWIRFGTFPEYFLLANLISLPLTEIIILCSIAATAFPCTFLVQTTDKFCHILCHCLKVISEMQGAT